MNIIGKQRPTGIEIESKRKAGIAFQEVVLAFHIVERVNFESMLNY